MMPTFAALPEPVQVFLREWVWWTLLNGFSVPLALPSVLVFLVLVLFFRFGIGLGLPRLFWHPERGVQFMVGIGIGAVLWQVFFAGYVFEEFATNFTVDRPPFCEVRPAPNGEYPQNAGIDSPGFPGRFRTPPANVMSVWWYAGVVAGAAAALALTVLLAVLLIQFVARQVRSLVSGWKPYQHPVDRPRVEYTVWLPLGAVAGWLLMTGLTAAVFALPREKVADPIGNALIDVAGWGMAAERRAKVEAHIAHWHQPDGGAAQPRPEADPHQAREQMRAWFVPYHPVYAAFVIGFAVIAIGSLVIIVVPGLRRLFAPAVGIVLLLNIAVFGTILLYVFPPLAVSGNFILLALLVLIVLAGRSYKFRFPNMPPASKPVELQQRYRELAEAEAGVTEDAWPAKAKGVVYAVAGGGPAVEPVFSQKIPYPHPAVWRGGKPPLAILSLSGGGSRAAAWAMQVLTKLEERFQHPGKGRPAVALPYHTRLIVGASGGMIAGGYYAASLAAPTRPGEVNRNEIHRAAGGSSQISHADLIDGVRQDLLTPVTHVLVNHDLPALFVPTKFGYDRGQALEDALRRTCHGQLHVPLASLGRGEAEGWRPSLIFAPMLVEDGRQLFLSNLDLHAVTRNRAFILGEEARPGSIDPEGFGLLSREGIEFFKLFPGATDFTVATAARMSASFPYVLPGVPLPTNPPRRVVDAGYYDNFGIGIAASWLFNHLDWIRENTSGVVVIQVRDGVSEGGRKREEVTDSFPPLMARGLHWLTTPMSGLWNSRMAANAFQNDSLLHLLEDFFLAQGLPPSFFATVAFELKVGDGVALNFSLSPDEARAINEATDDEKFNARADALVNWWHARIANPEGKLSLAAVNRA
jgi:hypothetical protein